MTRIYPMAIFIIGPIVSLLLFHNCTNVSLTQATYKSIAASAASGQFEICLPRGQELATFYARNLNGVMQNGYLSSDADADGLDDVSETTLYRSDPLSRRSRGVVLDSICLEASANFDCTTLPIICSPGDSPLRLNECDLNMLSLDKISSTPTLGLDSDRDEIPDLLEILGGSRAKISDAFGDPDGDQSINKVEYQFGTNPRQSDKNSDSKSLIQIDLTKNLGASSCEGDAWIVTVVRIPLIPVAPYFDPTDSQQPSIGIKLSHAQNENIIAFFVRTRAKSGSAGDPGTLLYSYTRQSYSSNDVSRPIYFEIPFTKAGDVFP